MTAPEPISEQHDVSRFDSGAGSLDAWLRRKARLNEAKGGARTYVVCDGDRVIGFYSLAASSVERRRVSSRVGRSMPQPIPVILLGQLAVDTGYRGRGLGADLLVDAARRALAAATSSVRARSSSRRSTTKPTDRDPARREDRPFPHQGKSDRVYRAGTVPTSAATSRALRCPRSAFPQCARRWLAPRVAGQGVSPPSRSPWAGPRLRHRAHDPDTAVKLRPRRLLPAPPTPAFTTICDRIHRHNGPAGGRRILGALAPRAQKHDPAAAEDGTTVAGWNSACPPTASRRHLDRRPVLPPLPAASRPPHPPTAPPAPHAVYSRVVLALTARPEPKRWRSPLRCSAPPPALRTVLARKSSRSCRALR